MASENENNHQLLNGNQRSLDAFNGHDDSIRREGQHNDKNNNNDEEEDFAAFMAEISEVQQEEEKEKEASSGNSLDTGHTATTTTETMASSNPQQQQHQMESSDNSVSADGNHDAVASPTASRSSSAIPSPPTPDPTDPTPHFYSKKHGKYLKKTPYGTMEYLKFAHQWIPLMVAEDDEEEQQQQERYMESWKEGFGGVDQVGEKEAEEVDNNDNQQHDTLQNHEAGQRKKASMSAASWRNQLEIKKRKREYQEDMERRAKRRRKPVPTIRIDSIHPDITRDQLAAAFSKCGVILKNENQEPKIEFLTAENTHEKQQSLEESSLQDAPPTAQGVTTRSALLTYLQEASVNLAITLFDDTQLPDTSPSYPRIRVRRATMEEVKEHSSIRQLDRETIKHLKKEKKRQMKQLHWTLKDDISAGVTQQEDAPQFKVLIIKNAFTNHDALTNPNLRIDLQNSLTDTCSQICGKKTVMVTSAAAACRGAKQQQLPLLKKIKVYLDHPEGVVAIHFQKARDAQRVQSQLDGVLYKISNASVGTEGHVLEAFIWKKRVSELKGTFEAEKKELSA